MNDFIYVKCCLGLDSKLINTYKLRTMSLNAESKLEEVLVAGLDNLGKPIDDPRITSIGKFLRRYWIDELPQIYNLARGDLKLVGIRPKNEREWAEYPNSLKDLALQQKPGLWDPLCIN